MELARTDASMTEKKMTIWEHLDELRSRLIRAIIAYVVGVCVAWAYREPMLAWLWRPFAESWRAAGIAGDPALNFAAPSDIFKAYFKLSMTGGLLIAAPIIFYQLWAYIAPGLYKKEKKIVIPFVFFSTVLFVGGGLFGWRIAFPITFKYFLELAGTDPSNILVIRPVVMMPEYLDFVSQMLLAFGIIFELPLFILFLSIAGLVNYLQLLRFGRWFILIAFIVGAILSPPDTTSQIAMSVPLCLLYFVSIGLAYLFGKRPSKEEIERSRAVREAKRLAKNAARELERRKRKEERDAEKRKGKGGE
jgi:sec-independent protein translocase protein TatC